MTVLSDRTIHSLLDNGELEIDPLDRESQIQPSSLDVRLADEIYDFEKDKRISSEKHVFEPGKRYLGHTQEIINLPNDIAASVAGRSTIGRMGLIVHFTAGWIDPSFKGSITLEIQNLGNEPIELDVGMRIAQLVFFRLDQPSKGYNGKYQGQEKPTKAR